MSARLQNLDQILADRPVRTPVKVDYKFTDWDREEAPVCSFAARCCRWLEGERSVGVCLLPGLLLLGFLDKAFHIDDGLVLIYGRLIAERPLNPFGQTFDWDATSAAIIDFPHPLLWQYGVAGLGAASGESEVALHLLTLCVALLGLAALRSLAVRLEAPPLAACLLLAGSSGFLVMGSSVMPDLAAMAFTLAALDRLVAAVETGHKRTSVWAGLLGGAAFLTRFSAAVTIGLLLLYPLFRRSRRLRSYLPFGIALGVAIGWELGSLALAGRPHLLGSLERWSSPLSPLRLLQFGFDELVFLGAQLPLSGLAAVAVGLRDRIGPALLLVSLLGALGLARAAPESRADMELAALLFAWPGLLLVLDAARRLLAAASKGFASPEPGDELRWVIAAWLIAASFATIRYEHVGVKHLLLPLPAAILLVLDGFRTGPVALRGLRWAWLWPSCLVGLAIGLTVAVSDYRWANGYRDFFERGDYFATPPARTYFNGQWGLRYYAERAGLQPYRGELLGLGDRVIVASLVPLNWVVARLPPRVVARYALDQAGPLELMSPGRAGFYSNAWGTFPFWPASGVVDTIVVLREVPGADVGPTAAALAGLPRNPGGLQAASSNAGTGSGRAFRSVPPLPVMADARCP